MSGWCARWTFEARAGALAVALTVAVAGAVGGAGCLPDDPVDNDDPFGDDDDFSPSEPEDCPRWAPEYKVGYARDFDVDEDADRTATFLGLQEWQGGVYWRDEVYNHDSEAVETWIHDHCRDGELYRVGTEEPDGQLTLFNPPVLQLKADPQPGDAWTSEYNLLFRHFTERYEVQGVETLEVPAGTYEALHVTMRLDYVEDGQPVIIDWDNWYVEELGLVKQVSSTPTRFELVSYVMPDQWADVAGE